MRNFLKVALSVSILSLSASTLMAQTQNPEGDKRPLPPDGQAQVPYNQKEQPTNDVNTKPGVGTRALSPGEGNSPSPAAKPNLKKLDKQGRGGQPQ